MGQCAGFEIIIKFGVTFNFMEARELRIGNLFYPTDNNFHVDPNAPVPITELCEKYASFRSDRTSVAILYKGMSAVPLTEEWLVKLGFEKIHSTFFKLGKHEFCLDDFMLSIQGPECNDLPCDIDIAKAKYVHQLQNLYFALTGEELTIKETATA